MLVERGSRRRVIAPTAFRKTQWWARQGSNLSRVGRYTTDFMAFRESPSGVLHFGFTECAANDLKIRRLFAASSLNNGSGMALSDWPGMDRSKPLDPAQEQAEIRRKAS